MKMKVGHWLVEAIEDEDGHLTVAFANDDQTKVVCCDEDITNNETEWSDRFTTEGIEKRYAEAKRGKAK